MTHQSTRVRAGGGEWRRQRWRRGENRRFKPPTQKRLTDLCPRTAALTEATQRGIAALISGEDDNSCVLSLSDHQSQVRSSILQRWSLFRVRSRLLFDSAAVTLTSLSWL